MPAVVRDLGGLKLYGWAFSAFMLSNLVGVVAAGGEADRLGPARPFAVGIGLFVLGLLLAGTAPAMAVVVAGRSVQGFGSGVIYSMAYVGIGRGYPERAKAKMLAVMSTAWVVPGLIGPALAGWVAEHAGWRWVFLGLVPLPPLAAGMALPALRQFTPAVAQTPDRRRILTALRLAVGTGLLLAGLGIRSVPLALAFLLPGMALAGPALRRLLPPGTLRARAGIPAAILMIGALNLAFFGVDAFVPLALTAVRGKSLVFASLALTAATLTWTTGAWVQAHLTPHGSRRAIVIAGLILLVLGVLGVAVALAPTVPAGLAVAAWGVAGLGMGLAYSTSKLVILEGMPAGQEGTIAASMQLNDVLGTALGTGIGGALLGYSAVTGRGMRAGIVWADLLMVVILGMALFIAARLPGRPLQRPDPRE